MLPNWNNYIPFGNKWNSRKHESISFDACKLGMQKEMTSGNSKEMPK